MSNIFVFCEKSNIRWLTEGEEFLFRASDVGRFLKLKNIHTSTTKWKEGKRIVNMDTGRGTRKTLMLTTDGIKRLVCNSRSFNASTLAKELCIDVHSNRYLKKETDSMTLLRKIFVGVEMVPQYRCGTYLIDMYLPSFKLAIECDEDVSHRPSKALEDYEREEYIKRDLGCTFIRYRPDDPDFDITKVAGLCFQKIMEFSGKKRMNDILHVRSTNTSMLEKDC